MYEIFRNVILNTPFSLSDIQKKINTNWVQSYLTDEERESLMALAAEHADPNSDLAPIQAQIDRLFEMVHEIEAGLAPTAEETPTEEEEFPEYVKPESKDQYYKKGDKVTYKGVKYIFMGDKAAGSDPITYPYYHSETVTRGWQRYEDYLKEQETTETPEG